MITYVWRESLLPGNEQRDYWGSHAADQPGVGKYHRHQEPRSRRDDRQGHRRQGSTRNSPPRPGRSTASCCGTITSCRSGPTTNCARRAGTVSAIRRPCRNTALRRFRRCGGGTRTRSRKREAGNSPPGDGSRARGFWPAARLDEFAIVGRIEVEQGAAADEVLHEGHAHRVSRAVGQRRHRHKAYQAA